MRTRILNKMTAKEVEDYLARGGNTIFVAVGVIEAHGAMPIDTEETVPEGFALAMAEKADGLCLINLPFFFPGGTIVSNATVQVSMSQSSAYLMMIARSLVAQGFRKILFVSAHGPAKMFIDPMCRDFFQETKVHVCHINLTNIFRMNAAAGKSAGGMGSALAGACKMLGMVDYLPVDPNAAPPVQYNDSMNPRMFRLQTALGKIGAQTSMYYAKYEHHAPNTRAFLSEEERWAACVEGEKYIRDTVDQIDLEEILGAIDEYHEYVQDIMKQYPRLQGQY